MKIGKGVEWAAHACALLAALPEGYALSRDALAQFLDVPPAYLAKQLQALSRANIIESQRGKTGGYRLVRPASEVSLWDITAAVEGGERLFRCSEVRRNGPCGAQPAECSAPCAIAARFWQAEQGYRRALADQRLSAIVADLDRAIAASRRDSLKHWIAQHAVMNG